MGRGIMEREIKFRAKVKHHNPMTNPENDFNVYIDGFKTDSFDVTHYLPIPKLEV